MIKNRPTLVLDQLGRFLSTPLDEALSDHLKIDAKTAVVRHFHEVAKSVPAYARFLREHHVDACTIKSYDDFQHVPLVTKPNYMEAYPLPERCRDGKLTQCDRLAVSSGSTGVPTFWPRAMVNELDIAFRFEQVFRHSFQAHARDTLAVVCFPLGNWVGGMFTTSCCWHLALKGYSLTVATPGNQPAEILRVIRELSPNFTQTVLLGYPPFVKDVIDMGLSDGIDWCRYNIKMVFAGEVFSEEWRLLMAERVGATHPCYDFASLYGTADGGVLGNETPLSIAIRRFLADHPEAARELFGESRLPTLVQYDPASRFFELSTQTLVVSGDGGVPLVRYHIADRGGLRTYDDMMSFLQDKNIDLQYYGLLADRPTTKLPFVWVFGRADFTVSFYGANIFPENIVVGLEQPDTKDWVTGKFVMETCHATDGSAFLRITVELAPSTMPSPHMESTLAQSISRQLLRLNSEFANYVPSNKQFPNVEIRPFADSQYFPPGVKHRYTRGDTLSSH